MEAVVVDYTNHRGERDKRTVRPQNLWFGSTEWHEEPQWLLDCWDVGKGARRTLAMKDIHSWEQVPGSKL